MQIHAFNTVERQRCLKHLKLAGECATALRARKALTRTGDGDLCGVDAVTGRNWLTRLTSRRLNLMKHLTLAANIS